MHIEFIISQHIMIDMYIYRSTKFTHSLWSQNPGNLAKEINTCTRTKKVVYEIHLLKHLHVHVELKLNHLPCS